MNEQQSVAFSPIVHTQPVFQVESRSSRVRGLAHLVRPIVMVLLRATMVARTIAGRGRRRPPPNEKK